MFNLFRSKKTNIDAITIPDFGWEARKDEASVKLWVNAEHPIALSLNFFDQKPDIPTLTDIAALRSFYRTMALQAHGGIIEVTLIDLQGYAAVKTVLKIPQEQKGTTYLVSLTIPFRACSFVVKVQAMEVDATNMRGTLVLDQLMETGLVKLTDNGLEGWNMDPYDPHFREGRLMNLSERQGYDAQFPEHPLSLARGYMDLVLAEMRFATTLEKVARF
jgi:hypothetical protein